MPGPDYRLYIDEAGDHTECTSETDPIGKRYLGLTGVALRRGQTYQQFCDDLDVLKRKHVRYDPDDPPVLHREDILNRRGPFWVLKDAARRDSFDADLLALLGSADYRVFAVVIDKLRHGAKTYRTLTHPYHYCLLAMLERYCGWLSYAGNLTSDVMVEARGGREDRAFEEAYEGIYQDGGGAAGYLNRELVQATLTSKKPKLQRKEGNIAGLQLADTLAHPLTRDVLVAYRRIATRGGAFADAVARAVEPKYNLNAYRRRIDGYGRVILA